MTALITSPNFIGGADAALGKLYTYVAGTNTPKATFQDAGKSVSNSTPVDLNARGEAVVYLDGTYKLKLVNAAGTELWTRDNISDFSQLAMEFGNQADAIYYSPNQFRIAGNVTALYSVGRRFKAADAVTIYGEITESTYAGGNTTIKVITDNAIAFTNALTAAYVSIVSPLAYIRPTEWINDTVATFIDATTFTVTGDLTAIFTIGRRTKLEDDDTLYGTIIASSAALGVTTVVVAVDNDAVLTGALKSAAVSFVSVISSGSTTIPGAGMIAVPLAVIFKKVNRWFDEFFPGGSGAGSDLGDGVTNAWPALQAALNYTAANKEKLIIPTPTEFYRLNNGVGAGSRGIDTPNNMYMEQMEGAWFRPDFNSHGGTQFGNIFGDVQSVVWENAQIDMQDIDITATTGGPYGTGFVGDNALGFSGRPVSGDLLPKTQGIKILGGHIKNVFSQMIRARGPGGCAANFEQCAFDIEVDDLKVTNCTKAVFAGPDLDNVIQANGYAFNYRFKNIFCEEVGAMFQYLVYDTTLYDLPTADPSMQSCVFEGIGYKCGHHPDRVDAVNRYMNIHEKSGAIIIHGPGNVIVKAVIFNPPGFPSATHPAGGTLYPTSYPPTGGTYLVDNYTGGGMVGAIGSPVKGWGRNVKMDVDYFGNCDAIYDPRPPHDYWGNLGFADKQYPTGAFNNHINIRHYGTTKNAIRTAPANLHTTLIDADATHAMIAASAAPTLDNEYIGLYMWAIDGSGRGSAFEILDGVLENDGTYTFTLTNNGGTLWDNTTVVLIAPASAQATALTSHTSTVLTLPGLIAKSNFYIGDRFVVRDGNGAGQIIPIIDSSPTTVTLAYPMSPNPDNNTFNWMIATDIRAPNSGMSGWLDIIAGDITERPVHESANIYDNLRMRLRTSHGVDIQGTPAGIFNGYNNDTGAPGSLVVANSLVPHLISGKTYTILDDHVLVLSVADHPYGTICIRSSTSEISHDVHYRAQGSPICEFHAYKSGNDNTWFDTAVTALTGTTAPDNCFTVGVDSSGNIYFQNRRGVTVDVTLRYEN